MNEYKFNGMGGIYSQFRPSYPQEFIDYLYSDVGFSENSVIADVGSGTGLLTRQLLEKGSKVFAVEPNDDMRVIAETDLNDYSRFVSVKGSAENTTLTDCSVDRITVAQAFHWFDRLRFKAECGRILRSGGKVVLAWNSRDEESELVRENDTVIRKYCPLFKGYAGGTRGEENDGDFNDFFNGDYDIKVIRNDLVFDERGFVGRNLTSSYSLKESDGGYPAYVAELTALFKKYSKNGLLIVMPNLTRSYTGCV